MRCGKITVSLENFASLAACGSAILCLWPSSASFCKLPGVYVGQQQDLVVSNNEGGLLRGRRILEVEGA